MKSTRFRTVTGEYLIPESWMFKDNIVDILDNHSMHCYETGEDFYDRLLEGVPEDWVGDDERLWLMHMMMGV